MNNNYVQYHIHIELSIIRQSFYILNVKSFPYFWYTISWAELMDSYLVNNPILSAPESYSDDIQVLCEDKILYKMKIFQYLSVSIS